MVGLAGEGPGRYRPWWGLLEKALEGIGHGGVKGLEGIGHGGACWRRPW